MWSKIKAFFLHSETIFWSRLQVALGVIGSAIVAVDPSLVVPYIEPKYVPLVFALNGIVTEIMRRARAKDLE